VSRPLGDHGARVAVVTGGAGAIGGAIARAMDVAGVRVAVWDLDGGRAANNGVISQPLVDLQHRPDGSV
jgi:NAD(P)-dependent dehydrogenase (short-subunit alcohol dehydrogenase family)